MSLERRVDIVELREAKRWLKEVEREKKESDSIEPGGKRLVEEGYAAVLIPSGRFTMGCTSEQGDDCGDDESPSHEVVLSRSYYMMETEVTQGLYKSLMGENPSSFSSCGNDCPVESVSWYDAVRFANKLSVKEGLEKCYEIEGEDVKWVVEDCSGWRLPTEGEWEYAARGGESYKYAGSNDLSEVAWYGYWVTDDPNRTVTKKETKAVGQKNANGYGLYDMSGNVYEWCWDWKRDYSSSTEEDPKGPSSGAYRVFRGGSWNNYARYSRVSSRSRNFPSLTGFNLGFRLIRTK